MTLFARNSLNVPVNLTGLTVSWAVAKPPNAPDCLTALFSYTGTIVSAPAGSFSIPIAPGDTVNLDAGDYLHQAWTTSAAGAVAVVVQGRFRLRNMIGQTVAA